MLFKYLLGNELLYGHGTTILYNEFKHFNLLRHKQVVY